MKTTSLSAKPAHEAVCDRSRKTRGSGSKISSSTGSLGSRRDSRDRKTNLTPKRYRLRFKTRPATQVRTDASNSRVGSQHCPLGASRLNGMIRTVPGRRHVSVQQFAGSETTQFHLKNTIIDTREVKDKAQSTSNYLESLHGDGESISRVSIQTAVRHVNLSLSHFDIAGLH